MLLYKTCINFEKMCKQIFYKNKILVENLEVRYYNNHIKKDIEKWI